MINRNKINGLVITKNDARLISTILRDAESLECWGPGQLDRRARAVQGFLADKVSGGWKDESSGIFASVNAKETEDEFLRKHGWNKVDSGFRLWGAADDLGEKNKKDDFLESKGWNDVDSGFRII
jgi:hypothetical protein